LSNDVGSCVEPLDVVEHVCLGLVSRSIVLARRAFGFQRREEALHRGIVPDVAGSAHAAHDAAYRPSAVGTAHCCIGSLDRSGAARHLACHDARSPSAMRPRPTEPSCRRSSTSRPPGARTDRSPPTHRASPPLSRCR